MFLNTKQTFRGFQYLVTLNRVGLRLFIYEEKYLIYTSRFDDELTAVSFAQKYILSKWMQNYNFQKVA